MRKSKYPRLDYDDIQLHYPLSVQKVLEWFMSQEDLVEGLLNASGEVSSVEEVRAAMQHVVPVIIQMDPRKLYEFFDDQNIRIFIGSHPSDSDAFVYHNSRDNYSASADSRVEAEGHAFIGAFKALEKELNEKKEGSLGKNG